MAISTTQFHLIQEVAESIFRSACSRLALPCSPPVPVELIANAEFGLKCCVDSSDDNWKGHIAALNPLTAEIRLAPFSKPSTRAFAVAHEVGHWVLHERRGEYKLRGGMHPGALLASAGARTPEARQRLQEAEANLFAAALLAPRQLLLDEALRFVYVDKPAVNQLAEQFHTSYMFMALRLHDLYRYDAWRGPSIDPQVFKGFVPFEPPDYEPVTTNEYHRRLSGPAREGVVPPLVIEFAGTPNSGKDTTMRILAGLLSGLCPVQCAVCRRGAAIGLARKGTRR